MKHAKFQFAGDSVQLKGPSGRYYSCQENGLHLQFFEVDLA